MVGIVEQNLEKIREACKAHNVVSLQLFGSAARGNDFTDESDIDFLVCFQQPKASNNDCNVFERVKNTELLQRKLESITRRKVDLIEERLIKNKYLRYFINKEKKMLYAKA